ncbi:hypothetical protein ASPNIDRAFT_131021 [Aspergillus niger ATCC 1015]|uniref:Zn(2)-C6 fungal-type domain-containing protein n=1 Tax=Aspergillus niger (strain ATCC 1015 / CBS 113.46 / FGSC A1144 / LSHB Ac4 / NCTC 3858a / NRRL 328 / USDA 3528.7) TaxID=380704 RepID=G3XVW3_ASPNA|nr:hypothetical protein ASPNIDRAFT_131021 [Aspergillus niger ATCC 1015]
MPSTSRPVKVACLACRASKIRCDGQNPCTNECQYQPSRRGGARRGPVAAEERARKKAQRLQNATRTGYRPSDTPQENLVSPGFPLSPKGPGTAVAQYVDKPKTINICLAQANASHLPYWPTTSLGLALAALLALIPPPGDAYATGDETTTLRRSFADLFARSALDASEESLEPSSNSDLTKGPCSPLHPDIPRQMEPVLALALLSLYECCQRGNVSKMRIRANQALTMAMDLSLHTQNCTITRQLSNETIHDQGCLPFSLHNEIKHLESSLLDIATETDRYRCIANCQGTEADAERSFYVLAMVLWRVRAALSAGNLSSVYDLLDRPSERTAIQDAERLEEELHMGIEALRASMKADGVYEGIWRMVRELESVYDATMMG